MNFLSRRQFLVGAAATAVRALIPFRERKVEEPQFQGMDVAIRSDYVDQYTGVLCAPTQMPIAEVKTDRVRFVHIMSIEEYGWLLNIHGDWWHTSRLDVYDPEWRRLDDLAASE